jgi:uncharacterized protein (TIGR04551 family)
MTPGAVPGFVPPAGGSLVTGPSAGTASTEAPKRRNDEVFAEDWWSHARPALELHGYLRLRAELFHRFDLARRDNPGTGLWPTPLDQQYTGLTGSSPTAYGPTLCTAKEAKQGTNDDANRNLRACRNRSQSSANLRLRFNPEIHISDNLRVMTQIDLLDNLVLGSTPQGYALEPDAGGGYAVIQRGGYDSMGAFDVTQEAPSAGVNSTKDSIRVKRAWAEYMTPVGQLRFGRMPSHWGLGILQNSGDGPDDDYQTTVDRIMFVTGLKRLDLYVAGAWGFVNEGALLDSWTDPQRQASDAAQLDDVDEYMLSVVRRTNPKLEKLALSRGNLVLNGGLYLLLRKQVLANDRAGTGSNGAYVPGSYPSPLGGNDVDADDNGYVRRGLTLWTPDLWLQVLYKTFRFELEAVALYGELENLQNDTSPPRGNYENTKIRAYGVATETEFRAIEDKLRLQLKGGWASGDTEATEPGREGAGGLLPGTGDGLAGRQLGNDDTLSTFRFHPNYRVDLILNRNILSRVQGSYYLRPSVEYDFMRTPEGQRLGGGAAAIWTRASNRMQAPGNARDLGVELNGKVYFQSKDGSLNDEPGKAGGFYTQLEYGVLFPLAGLGYPERTARELRTNLDSQADDVKVAQTLRWYLGVLF